MRIVAALAVVLCVGASSVIDSVGGVAQTDLDSRRVELSEHFADRGPPHGIVDVFCQSIPEYLLESLVRRGDDETAWTDQLQYSGGWLRLDSADGGVETWAIYLTENWGYFAILEGDSKSGDLLCAIDSLTSLGMAEVMFKEVTGDGKPEIVIYGLAGLGAVFAAEIISWDGATCELITPREEPDFTGRRGSVELVGSHIQFEDVDGDSTAEIGVFPARWERSEGDSRRPLIYKFKRSESKFFLLPSSVESDSIRDGGSEK